MVMVIESRYISVALEYAVLNTRSQNSYSDVVNTSIRAAPGLSGGHV